MKPLAIQKKPVVKTKLRVLNGPFKGRSFKLISNQIYIGRASEVNDVVLAYDRYCSRKHALLTYSKGRYLVENLSENLNLYINKKQIKKKAVLKNKDTLTVGQTQFQLEFLKKEEIAVIPQNSPALAISHSLQDHPLEEEKKTSLPRLILIALIILGGALFLMDSKTQDAQKKKQIEIRTQQDLEEGINAINQKSEELKKSKKDVNTRSFKNAQIAYLKGIRDFRKGYYGRAIENFRTCNTIYSKHLLCKGYLEKAQIKYEQLAQSYLILGQQHKKNKQYKQCMASFKIVMKMTSHNLNHPLYKEARSSHNLCDLQLKGRY